MRTRILAGLGAVMVLVVCFANGQTRFTERDFEFAIIPDAELGGILVRANHATGDVEYRLPKRLIERLVSNAEKQRKFLGPDHKQVKENDEAIKFLKSKLANSWVDYQEFQKVGGRTTTPK